MKLKHSLTPYTKVNSKWFKDLDIRHDTIKDLAENMGKTYSDINSTNIFLVSQGKRKKSKSKWDLIKLISFCTANETINQTKRQHTEWEKTYANDATDKGIISKIHKQLVQLNTKRMNSPIKKWSDNLNRHFSKQDIQMANRLMKRCSTSLIEKCKSKLQ